MDTHRLVTEALAELEPELGAYYAKLDQIYIEELFNRLNSRCTSPVDLWKDQPIFEADTVHKEASIPSISYTY